tara:strand:+ start:361 stop:1797 length:1437 start_codon:yes stop_codon:yes gene_type:complete
MPILPFQPDVLKHVVQRVTVGHRYQIDSEACIILNARLAGVDGDVTVTVYTDKDANYVSDNPSTADSEQGLIALSAKSGTSDSQNPMAPPTHADYGLFCKAEGTADKEALLELTYVHRCDYERSFEPIKIETVEGQYKALDTILGLPNVPTWEEGTDDGGGGGDPPNTGPQDASGLIVPIGEDPDDDPYMPYPKLPLPNGGGYIWYHPPELWVIEGQSDGFKVKLGPDNKPPLKDVVVSVTSSATGDLTVSPSTLTFTPSNFTTSQTVTITGVNDSDTESTENVVVTLAIQSGDDNTYTTDVPEGKFMARVVDTDTGYAAININRTSLHVPEGATEQIVKVSLTKQPSSNVTVDVGNLAEDGRWETGVGGSYASTKTLTFTNANWLTAQDVTVRATTNTDIETVDPLLSAFSYKVTASSDSSYAAIIERETHIPVIVYDNDATNFATGIFVIQAEQLNDSGESQLLTTESGNALIRNE